MALILALLLLAASFLLISPSPGQTYPGAIPWRDLSILRPLTELMSLNGLLATARGVEIKDFALHLAAALGLVLLALSALVTPHRAEARSAAPAAARVASYAQVFLAGWVLLSLASSLWSGEPDFARGQALLYALNLAWAVALAHTLRRCDLPRLLAGAVAISAVGAILCIWYYHERNPNHRPGFPVGNPTVLAAMILPAVVISLCAIGAAVSESVRARRLAGTGSAVAAGIALVPLIWCLALTQSRGASLALLVGFAAVVVLLVGRRLRWVLAGAFVAGILVAGAALYYTSHLDVTMARGAAMRFRVYAWRYAATLWGSRPFEGHGVGSYPRLAGQLAAHDRALDPAAFMGELVEHAHNELFEVLSEIGLVGGVTWVAGLLATFVAGALLVRRHLRDRERWYALGILGGLAALWADAMVGAAQRLPGGAAVTWTFMGVLWAICGSDSEPEPGPRPATGADARPARRTRCLNGLRAALCLAAAAGAGWLAVRNWAGVRAEQNANVALGRMDYGAALDDLLRAEPRLLDPVRKVIARDTAVWCRFAAAYVALGAAEQTPATAPTPETRERAIKTLKGAYAAALDLRRTVPALERTDALAARAATYLAGAYRDGDPNRAEYWWWEAGRAWRQQQLRTPCDVETLLSLRHYPGLLTTHLALLRDALRFADAQGLWLQSLAELGRARAFEHVLAEFVAAAGPITPETDLDALIASLAPETYRLAAAWAALQGQFGTAAAYAARAAELYWPMRPRFPKLYSVALAEQAEYAFRGTPEDAGPAITLLRTAIDALPKIQTQQYDEMVGPFRFALARYLLAGGEIPEALATARLALGEHGGEPEIVEQALHKLLQDDAADGVSAERVEQVARALCPQFPSFCAPTSHAASEPASHPSGGGD